MTPKSYPLFVGHKNTMIKNQDTHNGCFEMIIRFQNLRGEFAMTGTTKYQKAIGRNLGSNLPAW